MTPQSLFWHRNSLSPSFSTIAPKSQNGQVTKPMMDASRIASPEASLSRNARVFGSTNLRVSAAVNSALQPETSMHLNTCLVLASLTRGIPAVPHDGFRVSSGAFKTE